MNNTAGTVLQLLGVSSADGSATPSSTDPTSSTNPTSADGSATPSSTDPSFTNPTSSTNPTSANPTSSTNPTSANAASSTIPSLVECYQDLKEPGDFAKFLASQQKHERNRVLQDTRGHVYYFKRTINKKNKFGKACRCGVWVCRRYRRLYCCCAVYTFGDTIVGSTGPHNHDPISTENEGKTRHNEQSSPFKISLELKNQVRRHNRGPKVDSIRRSVQRAREQLGKNKRKRRYVKRGLVKQARVKMDVAQSNVTYAGASVVVNSAVIGEEVVVIGEEVQEETEQKPETAVVKCEQPSVAMETDSPGCSTAGTTEPKKDTLNEILEILNDMSKNSSHSYQMMCSQLLAEYLTGQTAGATEITSPAVSPGNRGTISTITIPLQDIPVSLSPPLVSSSPALLSSSPPLLTSSPPLVSSSPPFVSSVGQTSEPPTTQTVISTGLQPVTTPSSAAMTTPIASTSVSQPDISVISSNFQTSDIMTTTAPQPRPYTKCAPPPNVTITYNKEPTKPAVNPELRPVINLPALFDTPSSVQPPTLTKPVVTSSQSPMTSSPSDKSSELPPKSEYNILSDMTSLENLLDILKENSPIRDAGALRCTCKTMLRCNLHDIGPGKKRQVGPKPRKVLTRNDDMPKPARKKYCYRGSKKPYKFIPETFKDCQLPANEDTVIGTGHGIPASTPAPTTTTAKKGRGGRRSRGVKPVIIPPPPPPPPVTVMPSGVGLTPISPAPEPRASTSNTINLVPVTSVNGPSFENSKLLKAVPIGNGLYRLEEANESEMQAGVLSKPIFTTDYSLNNGILTPNNGILTPSNGMLTPSNGMLTASASVPFSPLGSGIAPLFSQRPGKPLTVIEHHPASSISETRSSVWSEGPQTTTTTTSTTDTTAHQLNSLLMSVLSTMKPKSDTVPLMIPAAAPTGTADTADSLSTNLVNQLIERLLSVDSPGADGKFLEGLNSSLSGITQHS